MKFFFKHANTHIALSKTQTRPCWAGLKGLMTWLLRHTLWGLLYPFLLIYAHKHTGAHTITHTPSPAEQLPQGSGKLLPSPTQWGSANSLILSHTIHTRCWKKKKKTRTAHSVLETTSIPTVFLCVCSITWEFQVVRHKCSLRRMSGRREMFTPLYQ